ncbi:MAG: hypothetical protein P8O15_00305 [Luminiphilus sp.]|nr:hypothetical protein [Luminiphilus sp.]
MIARSLVFTLLLCGTIEASAASVSGSSKSVSFSINIAPESIRITGPDGFMSTVRGTSFQSTSGLSDGLYRYEITAVTGTGAPRLPLYDIVINNGRESTDAQRGTSQYTNVVDHGVFRIVSGQVVSPDMKEE